MSETLEGGRQCQTFPHGTVEQLLRYGRYLESGGRRLNERQMLMLASVLALHPDRRLRVADLPLPSPSGTLEEDLAFLRRAGLVFTRREYFRRPAGGTPRLRTLLWDLRPLLYNLDRLARLWRRGQNALEDNWRQTGRPDPRPVYHFPPGFSLAIEVPAEVLEEIAGCPGAFYPLPEHWARMAAAFKRAVPGGLPRDPALTAQEAGGTSPLPETPPAVCRQAPTACISGGHQKELTQERLKLTPLAELDRHASLSTTEKGPASQSDLLDLCQAAARRHGQSPADWVQRATRLARSAANPAAYARTVLMDWAAHGPPETRRRAASGAGGADSEGSRERYL